MVRKLGGGVRLAIQTALRQAEERLWPGVTLGNQGTERSLAILSALCHRR